MEKAGARALGGSRGKTGMPVACTANDGAQRRSSGYAMAAGLRGPLTKTNGAAGRARVERNLSPKGIFIQSSARVYASRNR